MFAQLLQNICATNVVVPATDIMIIDADIVALMAVIVGVDTSVVAAITDDRNSISVAMVATDVKSYLQTLSKQLHILL